MLPCAAVPRHLTISFPKESFTLAVAGTRQLPTAELALRGTRARRVSGAGRGVQTITKTMVNVTRIYNCVAAVGACSLLSDEISDF